MQVKTNEQYMKVNNYGLFATAFVYIAVSLISIAMFGQNIESVVLIDIGTAVKSNGKAFWQSYLT